MEFLVVTILLTILAVAFYYLLKKDKELYGIILDAEPFDDYLYEAKIKLKNGKVVKKLLFSKRNLEKGLKVLIKPMGENLWKVKHL